MKRADAGLRDSSQFISNTFRKALVPAPQEALDDLLLGLEDSLGIAMIVAAAPSVDYKTTFGVNNLTIIL